jgi:hypothetical protein
MVAHTHGAVHAMRITENDTPGMSEAPDDQGFGRAADCQAAPAMASTGLYGDQSIYTRVDTTRTMGTTTVMMKATRVIRSVRASAFNSPLMAAINMLMGQR